MCWHVNITLWNKGNMGNTRPRTSTHLRLTHMKTKQRSQDHSGGDYHPHQRIGSFSTTQYSLVAPHRTSHLPTTQLNESSGSTPTRRDTQVYNQLFLVSSSARRTLIVGNQEVPSCNYRAIICLPKCHVTLTGDLESLSQVTGTVG